MKEVLFTRELAHPRLKPVNQNQMNANKLRRERLILDCFHHRLSDCLILTVMLVMAGLGSGNAHVLSLPTLFRCNIQKAEMSSCSFSERTIYDGLAVRTAHGFCRSHRQMSVASLSENIASHLLWITGQLWSHHWCRAGSTATYVIHARGTHLMK